MREIVPLTNAVAARMIRSLLSGRDGDDAILAAVSASVPNAQTAPVAKRAAKAKAGLPANDRSREHHSALWLLAAV